MRNNKKDQYKKVFTYFIGIYFVLSGVLVSNGDVFAVNIGDTCSIDADCLNTYTPSYCTTTLPSNGGPATGPKCTAKISTPVTTDTSEVLAPPKQMVETIKFTPQVSIPGSFEAGTAYNTGRDQVNSETGKKEMNSDLFAKYVGAFYKYGLMIVGIIAVVTLMGGGILWLTSAGNDGKVAKAKEMIFGSLAGVALLYGSYLILNTVNPALVQLKGVTMPIIAPVELLCCQFSDGADITTDAECVKQGGKRKYGYSKVGDICEVNGCCVASVKVGNTFITECLNTGKSLCTTNDAPIYELKFYNGACEKPESGVSAICANNMFSCENAKDGDSCTYTFGKTTKVTNKYGVCYGGKCYLEKDTVGLGMPCGNRGGSICYKNNCSGLSRDGKELYTDKKDFKFDDNCANGLSCCNTKTASD